MIFIIFLSQFLSWSYSHSINHHDTLHPYPIPHSCISLSLFPTLRRSHHTSPPSHSFSLYSHCSVSNGSAPQQIHHAEARRADWRLPTTGLIKTDSELDPELSLTHTHAHSHKQLQRYTPAHPQRHKLNKCTLMQDERTDTERQVHGNNISAAHTNKRMPATLKCTHADN